MPFADALTLLNAACGMLAIFIAATPPLTKSEVAAATLLLLLALVFDVLDGRVARRRHEATALGRELDSLADVISFGAAPACLGYAVGLRAPGDEVALLYFTLCGVRRLARYNVTAAALAQVRQDVEFFEGAPIPSSIVVVLLLLVLTLMGRTGAAFPGGMMRAGWVGVHPFVLVFVLSGSLMVAFRLRIPKP